MPCFSCKFHKLATNARLRPYIQVLNLIILELHISVNLPIPENLVIT